MHEHWLSFVSILCIESIKYDLACCIFKKIINGFLFLFLHMLCIYQF